MKTLFLYQPFKKGLFISGILTDKSIGIKLSLEYVTEIKSIDFYMQIGNAIFGIGWLF